MALGKDNMLYEIELIDWEASALVGKCITKTVYMTREEIIGKEVTMKTVFISRTTGRYVSDEYAKRYPSRVKKLRVKASNQFN